MTGVPEFQKDHCLVMVRFVYESMVSFIRLAKSLEVALGPGTGDLAIRAGIRKCPHANYLATNEEASRRLSLTQILNSLYCQFQTLALSLQASFEQRSSDSNCLAM